MENASKALLIAAAVLIAILLIAFGMRIFNSTKGTTDSAKATMDATEIATFNNRFLAYAGSQNGSQVKSLANAVIAHNANSARQVKFQGVTGGADIISAISGVDSLTKYTINIEDEDGDGYMDTITF